MAILLLSKTLQFYELSTDEISQGALDLAKLITNGDDLVSVMLRLCPWSCINRLCYIWVHNVLQNIQERNIKGLGEWLREDGIYVDIGKDLYDTEFELFHNFLSLALQDSLYFTINELNKCAIDLGKERPTYWIEPLTMEVAGKKVTLTPQDIIDRLSGSRELLPPDTAKKCREYFDIPLKAHLHYLTWLNHP